MGLAGYVIGMLNVMTMFVGVLAVGLGIGLASSGEESECVKFVQWRVVGVGAATLVLSLAGLLGAWYERAWWLLYFYVAAVLLLFLMLLLLSIAALLLTAQAADGVVVGASGHTYQLRSPSSSSSSSSWIESQLRKPAFGPSSRAASCAPTSVIPRLFISSPCRSVVASCQAHAKPHLHFQAKESLLQIIVQPMIAFIGVSTNFAWTATRAKQEFCKVLGTLEIKLFLYPS